MPRHVTFQGKPVSLSGPGIQNGESAPPFEAVTNDLHESGLPADKVTVLISAPSLDTSVCNAEANHFREAAKSLPETITMRIISRDLPFAQQRWCADQCSSKVQTLSDFRHGSFGKAYGLEMTDGPLANLLARSVIVVDRQGRVRYQELVPEVTAEPNYDAALAAAMAAAA